MLALRGAACVGGISCAMLGLGCLDGTINGPAFAAIWQRRERHREKPMDLPRNKFKAALVARRQQLGLWCTLGDPKSAEVLAGSGFDWLLLDTEHSPTDVLTVLPALQAVASYDVAAVVRPATNDTVLIKRYLDIGVQTLLIPYVQSAAEAQHAVAAMRYPPRGVRGVASVTRATRFGRVDNYARHASDELCL